MKKAASTARGWSEIVAPRLWEQPQGASTALIPQTIPKCRQVGDQRSKRMIDICNALGARLVVLWLAREGTYIRESKNALESGAKLCGQGR